MKSSRLTISRMIPANLANFSFSSWYPSFRHITIQSEILPLSDSFIEYLREDGIRLPAELELYEPEELSSVDDSGVETGTDWDSDDPDEEPRCPWLPDLQSKVKHSIVSLGGSVFPKLNWSAPKDACWILPNRELKCSSLVDILLLLKASTFVSYDLSDKGQKHGMERPELILRRWMDINPGWEFRCFVRHRRLIGITQRYSNVFYPHIEENSENLRRDIMEFFVEKIQDDFSEESFTFDVVCSGSSPGTFLLMDFNPFDPVTDAILFSWDELFDAEDVSEAEMFRFVASPLSIQPGDMRQYEIPADFTDPNFSTNGRSLFDMLDMEIKSQNVATIK